MSYLIGTEAFLAQVTTTEGFPGRDASDAEKRAADTARAWAAQVPADLIYLSVLTIGELLIMRDAARRDLRLLYQLNGLIDRLNAFGERTLDVGRQDMSHWARIWGALQGTNTFTLEESLIVSQALTRGFTYVGRRSEIVSALEDGVGLLFVDPLEWYEQKAKQ